MCRDTWEDTCLHAISGFTEVSPFNLNMAEQWFVGVDVGTGSARAGLFTATGKLQALSKRAIQSRRNEQFSEGSYEQSTTDIWLSVCAAVKVRW